MKVLMVSRILDSGGVVTHMMSLAQGLKARGWEVALAYGVDTGDHNHGPQWFRDGGVEVIQIPFLSNVRTLRGWKDGLGAFIKLYEFCRSWKPDILHVHFRSTSIYARFIEIALSIPFISTLHLSAIPRNGIFKFGTYWGRRTIAISQDIRNELIERFNVPNENIDLVYNGVDDDYFSPATQDQKREMRKKFSLSKDDFVICEIARLEPVKGQDVIIRAIKILKERGINVKLLLAGSGGWESELVKMIKDFDLQDRIYLCGYQSSRDILWSSDLNVLPSTVEGFAIVVAEAMLCGVPTIRTPAAGAVDQIVEGVTGFVVKFGDSESIAMHIENLSKRPQELEGMGKQCLEFSRMKFTLDIMSTATEKTYLRAIGK